MLSVVQSRSPVQVLKHALQAISILSNQGYYVDLQVVRCSMSNNYHYTNADILFHSRLIIEELAVDLLAVISYLVISRAH